MAYRGLKEGLRGVKDKYHRFEAVGRASTKGVNGGQCGPKKGGEIMVGKPKGKIK